MPRLRPAVGRPGGRRDQFIDQELTGVDQQLRRLRDARHNFVHRRRVLVAQLEAELAAAALVPAGPPAPTVVRPSIPPAPLGVRGRPAVTSSQPMPPAAPQPSSTRTEARAVDENSPWTVQNVLLSLGGLLLSVAAVVFTVVAWGRVGIGGRAAMLAALTIVVLAVPALLNRHGLRTTALAVASVGLVFLGLDAYAARASGLLPDSLAASTYAGLAVAIVAAIAATYPALVPNRFMRPLAVVLAQAVLPLLVVADLRPGATGWAAVALLVAAADGALGWRRKDEVMIVACGCGGLALVAAGGRLAAGVGVGSYGHDVRVGGRRPGAWRGRSAGQRAGVRAADGRRSRGGCGDGRGGDRARRHARASGRSPAGRGPRSRSRAVVVAAPRRRRCRPDGGGRRCWALCPWWSSALWFRPRTRCW
ncbi:hypothetical protein [Fodinicola feengrottensis]|uniref:hypothetical protein n=1 Tax=Fodinicola feengrottensis TaxID=435914 RepID=UPI0013D7E991|nr:hypothetical protein [Fodinicola feengrottensis]